MKNLLLILSIFFLFETAFSQEINQLKDYLSQADTFIKNGDLNGALEILKTGKQKALSTSGENSDIYADFCEKTGLVYLYAKKYSDAKNLWIKTLGIRKNIYGSNHLKVSDSYNNLGGLYSLTGEYYKSLKLYQKALKIREEILPENDMKIASSLLNTGRGFIKTGNPDLALNCFLRSLKIKKTNLNSFNPDLASLYTDLGAVYLTLGEYKKSITNYKNALRIKQHNLGEDNTETAGLYANLANVLNSKGDYPEALEYNTKALSIFKVKYGEEHRAVARILINIGSVYLKMNDIKKAVENFNNSLEISKKLYETWNLKTAQQYTKIGKILNENLENIAAENYFNNALKIQRTVLNSDNHLEIAESFLNIGNANKDDGNYYSAIEYYNKSLTIRLQKSGNKHPETARLYKLTASVYEAKKGYAAELKNLQKALVSNIENFDSQDITVNPVFNNSTFYFDQKLLLETLNMKADAFWNLYLRTNNVDNLKHAYKVYELSDLIIEKIKKTVLLKNDKQFLAENISEVYKKAAALCIQLYKKTNDSKYYEKAFIYSEKNKRGILLSLPEATKFAGVPDSELSNETDLLADITYFKRKVSENIHDTKSRTKLSALYRDYDSFITDIKQNSPNYYDLKYNRFSVTVQNIQDLINDSTLILDYFCPDSSKYLYVYTIGKNKTDIHFIKNIDDFNAEIASFRKHLLTENESSVSAYIREAYSLYEDLLPDISVYTPEIKQLIIIPDGNIGIIPFEALLTEEYNGNRNSFKDYPFLIKKYAVSYSLSADLLPKFLYKDTSINNYNVYPDTIENVDSLYTDTVEYVDSTYMDDWLGIAPVFDNSNTNLTTRRTRDILKETQKTFQINSRTHLLSGNNIFNFPESENEVTTIYNEFENSGKSPETEMREEADEEFVKSIDSEEFKIIHIASYGFINSENPEFSGILLAHNNTDEEDGVLFMNELFDLELNSDLIVLPYFETGIKAYRRGEGMVGMTRALLYTGTKNIMLSLWQISDNSTEKLMLDFYKNVLENYNNPYGYNHSLRAAKLQLIEEGNYAQPYFWSPFILIGN